MEAVRIFLLYGEARVGGFKVEDACKMNEVVETLQEML